MDVFKRIPFFALVGMIALVGCSNKRAETIKNIKMGVETETTASLKYAAYAQKAESEGHDTIAKLFYAASKSEEIHASNLLAELKTYKEEMGEIVPNFKVNSTAENLKETIESESKEVDVMYPMFLEDAKSQKLKKTTIQSLTWALISEKKHVVYFKAALEALNSKTESSLPFHYYVCPVCGSTFSEKNLPEKCDLCSSNKALFLQI